MDEQTRKDFERWKKTPPRHFPHMSEEEIREKMNRLMPNSWRLEGNLLKGRTDLGTLVQTIPTNYILTGTDEKGLPIFKKIG